MSAQLPPLAAVRAFEAAARLLNFTEAANELGMTQAAVSYQIKLLEQRLGLALFNRIGRRVELTAQGQALAGTVIRAFEDMRGGFAGLKAENDAVLTVSCTNSFAHLWLAPRIGRFQMRQPDLAVRILTADRIVDLAAGQADIAVRRGIGPWPGVTAEPLGRNRIAVVCSPDFVRLAGPFSGARDLLRVARLSPSDRWWSEWFRAMGVDDPVQEGPSGIALDSQVLEGRTAMAGQGVALVTPYLWKAELDAGLLVEPVPSWVVETARYFVAYPPANRNQPKIKAFRDWIREEFAADKAADPEGRYLPPDER